MNSRYLSLLAGLLGGALLSAQSYEVTSPDGKLRVDIDTEDGVRWSLHLDGVPVLEPSRIRLEISGEALGAGSDVIEAVQTEVDETLQPVVRQKSAHIRDHYRQLSLQFEGDYALDIRAYDDGAAYRWRTRFEGAIEVTNETVELRFPAGTTSLFPEEESMISHNERQYIPLSLEDLDASRFASLPVMMTTPGGPRVLFSEADLFDFPAMYVRGGEGASLEGIFPPKVLEVVPAEDGPDRNEIIVESADHIAATRGDRTFPWRLCVVGTDDRVFLETQLVYQLSRPLEIEDPSWIRPGRIAWDWYNANQIWGVDFEAGINTETYQYYIDFAAEHGLEYVILDEGWSISTTDVSAPNPEMDVKGLIEYGRERGVGIILWSLWGPVDREAEELFSLYQKWGAKGVKLDFMQRSDQAMVNFYTRAAKVAAKHELLVDFHGSFKPAGLRRAFPNVLSYEGVMGNENNKWSSDLTPRHNVTIPFIRMAVGPMDYTPGALVNTIPENHRISHFRPMGIGTRAHEVAKFVVFESPLQMLCDSPSRYRAERETTEFIVRIPSVWDQTIPLPSEIGEYVAIARRSGHQWFIGVMTNEEGRSLPVDFAFLPEGEYALEIFSDGANAHRYAEDYKCSRETIRSGETREVKLAPGGGWTGILTPL